MKRNPIHLLRPVGGIPLHAAVHVGHIVQRHQTREHGHHHLRLHLRYVLGQSVNTRPNLTRHRNRVFRIRQIVLRRERKEQQRRLDNSAFNC